MQAWALAAAILLGRGTQASISDHERKLFEATAGIYLTRDSWTEPLAYLHGHFLMVPMHAAVLFDDDEWIARYEQHFARFVNADRSTWVKNPLSRAQYLCLGTRFLALLAKTGKSSEVASALERTLRAEIVERWTTASAIQWEHAPFRGVKARLDYKQGLIQPEKSYFRAITDEEFFLFAEAADLLVYRKHAKIQGRDDATLQEIVGYAARLVRTEGVRTTRGGWLFQVGAWRDHPDNKFSAQPRIEPGMRERRYEDVTMDSSHFHRFALFFNSLAGATQPGTGDHKLFTDARAGLATQLETVVLKKPSNAFPGWRLTNYMNGWNGVYRYDSNRSVGEGKGYGPYQLSGTFLLGWWSFLADPEVNQAYLDISGSFPLIEPVLETYLGPTYATPPRKAKSWYENGLAELLTSLAAKMPSLL